MLAQQTNAKGYLNKDAFLLRTQRQQIQQLAMIQDQACLGRVQMLVLLNAVLTTHDIIRNDKQRQFTSEYSDQS